VDEVHAQALHLGAEVAMPVPAPGASVEVEAPAPSVGQGAHPLEADSSSGPERLWPPRRAQARAQVLDLRLWKGRLKRFGFHGRGTIARGGFRRDGAFRFPDEPFLSGFPQGEKAATDRTFVAPPSVTLLDASQIATGRKGMTRPPVIVSMVFVCANPGVGGSE